MWRSLSHRIRTLCKLLPFACSIPAQPIFLLRPGVCDCQAGSINSVGALHDARSKQLPLNPLRARRTSVGQAANPVIRQQSMVQQTQAKQTRHFAGVHLGLTLSCDTPNSW